MRPKLYPLILILILLAGCIPATNAAEPASVFEVESTSMPAPATQEKAASDASVFTLTSPDLPADGRLPIEYTCDGDGSTLALTWNGAPAATAGYAVIMHHIAFPDDIHWYWVLYNLPADVTSLAKNVNGVGTLGNNVNNGLAAYSPPCSQGPGDKEYIYTVYALSAQPQITVSPEQVDRATLLDAIQGITLASAELHVIYARAGMTDTSGQQGQPGGIPPTEAIAACTGKAAQAACSFTSPKGNETGVCEIVQNQLACSPQRGPKDGEQGQGNNQPGNTQYTAGASAYNIEQAISDKAQGMTISYDALAAMTGDLGADSFFPPGKVADFWGFQYLLDNDPSEMGHAGDFLTSAAMNTLNNLTKSQRAELVALATSQISQINEYGYRRFVLIDAFRRQIEGDLPTGTTSLDLEAVKAYSAELYRLDGEISFARAALMGKLINEMSVEQKAYFDAMKGKGMKDWPDVEEPSDIRGLDRDVKVAVMTCAADMYSWYAGSVEADIYFCPERHGTYFGSFYLKDIKAMSDPTYSIPTNLTSDLGEIMLQKLNSDQAQLITGLVDIQKPALQGIVSLRRQISIELRKFLAGGTVDKATVLSLMEQYGAYDGEIIYNMAMHFAQVKQSLSATQQADLDALRADLLGDQSHPAGAYLYSQAIPMPEIPDTDFLFK
jgi:phosphatidylethanolamine-binding protein (PEBP) family uncharacterized protein